jgi:hypothetical protein
MEFYDKIRQTIKQTMIMRKCSVCGEEINPKRIEILPNTQTCVQHSTVEKKAAVTVQMGEGDHTWTETFAVDREEYRKLEEMENNFRKTTDPSSKIDIVDFDEEDQEEEEMADTKHNLNLDDLIDIIE